MGETRCGESPKDEKGFRTAVYGDGSLSEEGKLWEPVVLIFDTKAIKLSWHLR